MGRKNNTISLRSERSPRRPIRSYNDQFVKAKIKYEIKIFFLNKIDKCWGINKLLEDFY